MIKNQPANVVQDLFNLFDPVPDDVVNEAAERPKSERLRKMALSFGSNAPEYDPDYHNDELAQKCVLLAGPVGQPGEDVDITVKIVAIWPTQNTNRGGVSSYATFAGILEDGYTRVRFSGARHMVRIGQTIRIEGTADTFINYRDDEAVLRSLQDQHKFLNSQTVPEVVSHKPRHAPTKLGTFVPFTKLTGVSILTDEVLKMRALYEQIKSTD